MFGFVYVLSNPAMPGLFKIGFSERAPSARCEELSAATGVPHPFEIVMAAEAEDPQKVELDLHKAYSHCRINSGREFFRLSYEQILEIKQFLVEASTFTNILMGSGMVALEEEYYNPMQRAA